MTSQWHEWPETAEFAESPQQIAVRVLAGGATPSKQHHEMATKVLDALVEAGYVVELASVLDEHFGH